MKFSIVPSGDHCVTDSRAGSVVEDDLATRVEATFEDEFPASTPRPEDVLLRAGSGRPGPAAVRSAA